MMSMIIVDGLPAPAPAGPPIRTAPPGAPLRRKQRKGTMEKKDTRKKKVRIWSKKGKKQKKDTRKDTRKRKYRMRDKIET